MAIVIVPGFEPPPGGSEGHAVKVFVKWVAMILGVASPGMAPAADWFWRPMAGGPYGAQDGSSYADAWHMATSIAWNRIRPGDTLYVCGLHDGGSADSVLHVQASGTPASPILISGACPGDPGSILGGAGPWRDGWSGPDRNGVYSRRHSGSSGQMLDEDGYVARQKGPPDATWPCRSFSQVGRTVYYKPCGALQTVYADGRSPVVRVRGQDHVHVDQLSIRNAGNLIEVSNARGFRITKSQLRYSAGAAIMVVGQTQEGVISGNHVQDAGNGIIFITPGRGGGGGSHDDWVVEDNHIHDVYANIDAHCIGLQAGSGNVIRRNRLHDCEGSAITFYDQGRGAKISNNVVEYNVIHDVHDTGRGGSNQRGIEINGHNCPRHPDDATGNVIRHNEIRAVDHEGIFLKTGRPTASGVVSWAVTDNTISDVGIGLYWVDSSWYGEAKRSGADPCARANLIPALSRPGFLFARNTVSKVRQGFVVPKAINLRAQSEDLSGVQLFDNVYVGAGHFIWQQRGVRCRGAWDATRSRCTVRALADFQLASGREQGSLHTPSPEVPAVPGSASAAPAF